jgi:diguanylate cyclase (GGDEF)-like protein
MRALSKARLSRRIALVVGAATSAAGVLGVWLVLTETTRAQTATTRRLLTLHAGTLAATFEHFDPRVGRHPIDEVVARLADAPELTHLEVLDGEGRVRWSRDPRRRGQASEAGSVRALLDRALVDPHVRAGDGRVEVVLPLRKAASCLPCHERGADPLGAVHVTVDRGALLGEVAAFVRRAGVATGLFVLAITGLLLLLIDRVVVRRVQQLAAVMTRAEEGDYLVRAEEGGADELGRLTATFNRMLAKITDLRVERIESDREMAEVKVELALKAELEGKRREVEAANRRLAGKVAQLGFLSALGRDLASRLDLDELLEHLLERVTEALEVPEVAVLLFDATRERMLVYKARGFGEGREVQEVPFDPADGPSGQAVREGRPVYLPDLAAAGVRPPYRADAAPAGSLLAVPLVSQGEALGVLAFSSPATDAFPAADQELLGTVAQHAALALANARLFQATLALSVTDGLTGILNRRALESRLEMEWSRAERDGAPLSLVMVDIDHFKHHNDTQGHQVGDETLRRVARLLERNVRKVDAVGRYGGEEFLVILPRAGREEALEVASKLRRSVEQADFLRGYLQPLGRVTVSCGVASAPADAAELAALVRLADEALFVAKKAGRNRVEAAPAPARDPAPRPGG